MARDATPAYRCCARVRQAGLPYSCRAGSSRPRARLPDAQGQWETLTAPQRAPVETACRATSPGADPHAAHPGAGAGTLRAAGLVIKPVAALLEAFRKPPHRPEGMGRERRRLRPSGPPENFFARAFAWRSCPGCPEPPSSAALHVAPVRHFVRHDRLSSQMGGANPLRPLQKNAEAFSLWSPTSGRTDKVLLGGARTRAATGRTRQAFTAREFEPCFASRLAVPRALALAAMDCRPGRRARE